MNITELSSRWNPKKEFIIFGDYKLIPYLELLNIKYIVDNDEEKWEQSINSKYKIMNPKILKSENNPQIIVANKWGGSTQKIFDQLNDMGFEKNVNYISHKTIFILWKWIIEKKKVLPYIEYIITNNCNFKCDNCILFMPIYKKKSNVSFENIKKDIDILFDKIDELYTFRIVGGEPLLHPNLCEILEYISHKYRNKITEFELITNGSIMFNNKLINIIKEYDIFVHISNYTNEIDYSKKVDKLIYVFNENIIKYENALPDKWGWKKVCHPAKSNDIQDIKALFNNCLTHCRGLSDGKVFFCSMHNSAIKSGHYMKIKRDDYINLNEEIDISEIIDFESGKISKGYVSFCENCFGIGSLNNTFVNPGKQL